jgi:hypothetical protein
VAGLPATRRDVERWLSRVPVVALGLGPDELFYVPLLRLRLPRGGGGAFVPDLILERLRTLLAAAVRGHDRRFSPGQAYRFAGRGRYHAWLIRLWVGEASPEAREAFWAATGHPTLAGWQRAALLREGPELVAAIARLAEEGQAARWIAHFEAADYALAERALEVAFGLPIRTAPVEPARFAPPAIARREAARFSEPIEQAAKALAARGNDWPALPSRGKALLVAAVLTARTPGRQSSDAARLGAQIAAFAAHADAPPRLFAPVSLRPDAAVHPLRPATVQPHAQGLPQLAPASPAAAPARPLPRASTAPPGPTRAEGQAPARPTPAAGPCSRGAPDPRRPTTPLDATAGPVERHPSSVGPFLASDTSFETRFGGLLFLVNAFVALGLYPDFTRPRGKRLEPSPLWLADRIGRYFFGARYRRDPLSRWIAGRAAPGRLPRRWKAQDDWLSGFPPARRPRLSHRCGRATLWHPAGFPLLDAPAHRAPRRAIAALPPARLPLGPDRWAACLALYLDARLRLFTPAGLSLLDLPATVTVRDLDILACFRLDSHPIALRMAGLDRDPGWQPAEGRAFAFSFL